MSKVAVVTGGARGIGTAIAKRLAGDGLDIAILDVDVSQCAATVAALGALGSRALAITVNVADEASVAAGYPH